ncbi:unnamed protein product [Pleuronectes platessa]|uniref:Uncharacterized protein n=1 Tax=Pleuronectes platessa TaxID=8262 RepID=A0A9N7W1D2_PLEPL|nr:unnamed protein product [Pleuronectes platessa]
MDRNGVWSCIEKSNLRDTFAATGNSPYRQLYLCSVRKGPKERILSLFKVVDPEGTGVLWGRRSEMKYHLVSPADKFTEAEAKEGKKGEIRHTISPARSPLCPANKPPHCERGQHADSSPPTLVDRKNKRRETDRGGGGGGGGGEKTETGRHSADERMHKEARYPRLHGPVLCDHPQRGQKVTDEQETDEREEKEEDEEEEEQQ